MAEMYRICALGIVAIFALSCLIMAESASSQTVPNPPEFTLKFVDKSYDVNSSNSIDPFTGKTIVIDGYHVDNRTVELTIKNQEQINGLYYNIRYRGHFGQDWWYPFGSVDSEYCLKQSNSVDTVVVFICSESTSLYGNEIYAPYGQIDFQVKAFVGGYEQLEPTPGIPQIGGQYSFKVYSVSDWSSDHSVNIPEINNSSSPVPSPSVPEFPISAILILLVVLPLIATVLLRKKRKMA